LTHVKENLTVARRILQSELHINLAPFYNALKKRSEDEIDRALREFFAKAVLGLLTRMNRDYIAGGPGRQKRFKSVVFKLKDLIFRTREFDRRQSLRDQEYQRLEGLLPQLSPTYPRLCVQGAVSARFELCIQGIRGGIDGLGDPEAYKLVLQKGKRSGTDEIRVFEKDEMLDIRFAPTGSLKNVCFCVDGNQVQWKDI